MARTRVAGTNAGGLARTRAGQKGGKQRRRPLDPAVVATRPLRPAAVVNRSLEDTFRINIFSNNCSSCFLTGVRLLRFVKNFLRSCRLILFSVWKRLRCFLFPFGVRLLRFVKYFLRSGRLILFFVCKRLRCLNYSAFFMEKSGGSTNKKSVDMTGQKCCSHCVFFNVFFSPAD